MKQFPIGCWNYCDMDRIYPEMVKNWADLGFNNPLTPCFSSEEGNDPAQMLALLDECASYGMEAYLYDTRALWRNLTAKGEEGYRKDIADLIQQFGSHPAVRGFYIGDEPDAPDAADAFKAAAICDEMAPDKIHFLNLLPWFDWIGERIGSDAYAPYLDRAAKEGNLKLLAYDCYTQMWDGDSGFDVYFNNLREHSEASARAGIDFCPTQLAIGHYDYRCPSQDDFRWQISTAAALGAKALYWFYVQQFDFHENYRNPLLTAWNRRTEQYYWLADEVARFQGIFGETLLKLTLKNVGFTRKTYGGIGSFVPDEKILGFDSSRDCNLLISRFEDAEGGNYLMLVNVDIANNTSADIAVAPGVSAYRKTLWDGWDLVKPISDAVGKVAYGKEGNMITLRLAAGQMELLKIEG